jgi:hypothetical protein
MLRFVAMLTVIVLAGAASLAPACDLQCQLIELPGSTSGLPCHSHDSHPAAPKHTVQAQAVSKALDALLVPLLLPVDGAGAAAPASVASTFSGRNPAIPAPFVLRI